MATATRPDTPRRPPACITGVGNAWPVPRAAEERGRYLGIALKQTQRLQKQIEQLFDYARLEANERKPQLESFPILELLYDVVNKFRIRAERQQVRLTVDAAAENLLVHADIGLVESLLDNLIDNALQHTPAAGEVTLSAVSDGGLAMLSVADSGSGIAPSQRRRVFDSFYRADDDSRSGEHAGLGLAIAKKIIELHGQSIEVGSSAAGGAEFRFTLQQAR